MISIHRTELPFWTIRSNSTPTHKGCNWDDTIHRLIMCYLSCVRYQIMLCFDGVELPIVAQIAHLHLEFCWYNYASNRNSNPMYQTVLETPKSSKGIFFFSARKKFFISSSTLLEGEVICVMLWNCYIALIVYCLFEKIRFENLTFCICVSCFITVIELALLWALCTLNRRKGLVPVAYKAI